MDGLGGLGGMAPRSDRQARSDRRVRRAASWRNHSWAAAPPPPVAVPSGRRRRGPRHGPLGSRAGRASAIPCVPASRGTRPSSRSRLGSASPPTPSVGSRSEPRRTGRRSVAPSRGFVSDVLRRTDTDGRSTASLSPPPPPHIFRISPIGRESFGARTNHGSGQDGSRDERAPRSGGDPNREAPPVDLGCPRPIARAVRSPSRFTSRPYSKGLT